MQTTPVQAVVAAAQRLSPTEQLEVLQALTHILHQQALRSEATLDPPSPLIPLPPHIRRTPPVTDLALFAADFWPDDETADDITTYISQQRTADRMRDLPDGDL